MKYNVIEGDLIKLALEGRFDVISHGCNCFCTMGAGIAVPMAKTFHCDQFWLEQRTAVNRVSDDDEEYTYDTGNYGDINKLGQIEYQVVPYNTKTGRVLAGYSLPKPDFIIEIIVVNSYTQYSPGKAMPGHDIPLDYTALRLCMMKINHIFKGKHIGLPKIGAGLAGGDWNKIEQIIKEELKDCDVTVVSYKR